MAGAICFPSSWAPEEKLGLPVHTIHDPVPTLNEQLGVRIGKFLAGIRPGKAWERVNWGLSGSPGLNQHPAPSLGLVCPNGRGQLDPLDAAQFPPGRTPW